jgi:hypothetical protein
MNRCVVHGAGACVVDRVRYGCVSRMGCEVIDCGRAASGYGVELRIGFDVAWAVVALCVK